MSAPMIRSRLAVGILCCAVMVCLFIISLHQSTLANGILYLNIPTTEDLGGAERYLTFISTDKPMYKAGEKVYVRSVMLNAANHKPLSAANKTDGATIQIRGPKGDLEELASLKSAADLSNNNYVVALAANAFELSGDKAEAHKLMDRLAAKQKTDGSLDGVTASIVGSGGQSLEVEGTSLATLAWLREPAYAGNVEQSIKFLADSCKAGRYGSTQATVLALRAIVNYDKQNARIKTPGKLRLYVDGQSVGDWIEFSKSTQGAIKLPDMSEFLTPGQHKLELRMQGGRPMPYSLALKYNASTPASSKVCKLNLTVQLAQNKIGEGAATEANVTVFNKTNEALPTPTAIIGLPGGMELRHDQLKELVKKGTIDAYEVRGREVVLYWRTIRAHAKLEIPISLIAAIPGTYTGPASRAYLYYTDEHKQWVDGLRVEIAAK